MAIQVDFYISGVWYTEDFKGKRLSHALLHERGVEGWRQGVKTTQEEVIRLVSAGKVVFTIRWDYGLAKWVRGAHIVVEEKHGLKYLQTEESAEAINRLDHLVSMFNIV